MLFPQIRAVLSPRFGVEVGAVTLICTGVYAAGNRTELAVPMTLGCLAGDCWVVLALWMMELRQLGTVPLQIAAALFAGVWYVGVAVERIHQRMCKK